jgi:hypothetical protein
VGESRRSPRVCRRLVDKGKPGVTRGRNADGTG